MDSGTQPRVPVAPLAREDEAEVKVRLRVVGLKSDGLVGHHLRLLETPLVGQYGAEVGARRAVIGLESRGARVKGSEGGGARVAGTVFLQMRSKTVPATLAARGHEPPRPSA